MPITILDQAMVSTPTHLYSFGGVSNNAVIGNVYRFDGATWTAMAALPQPLEYPAAVYDGTNIFILGGASSAGTPLTVCYRYNVATNNYTTMASFTTGTWNQTAVYLSGKIYKFCGTGAAGSVNNLEIYDIATNTWSAGAPYPLAISFVSAAAQGGFIWAGGGIQSVGSATSLKTYRYDPVGNTWNDAAMADLPETRWGAAADYYSSSGIIFAGGYVNGSPGTISNTAVTWNPSSNTWTALPNMPVNRSRLGGAMYNGYFHTAGGRQVNDFIGTTEHQRLFCVAPTPCTGTPAPGNTMSSANPACPGRDFTLSPQNVTIGTGVTYQWQTSPNGTSWTDVPAPAGTSGSFTTNQTVATYYRVRVTCTATSNSAFTTPLQVTMSPIDACYCVPTYTNGCTLGDYIARVQVGSIDNSSLCSTPPYTYYSAIPPASIIRGATNQATITVGPDTFGQWVGIWIDLNRDGDYADAGEFVSTPQNAGAGGTVTMNMNIPATATLGLTRMRIRAGDDAAMTSGQSCGASNSTFGEAEDYHVVIDPCIPGTFASHPSNTSVQCSGSTTFTVTATGSLLTYFWEYKPVGSPVWLLVPNSPPFSGANTSTLTISNAPSTLNGALFRAVMSGACSAPDFSNSATLTVTPLIATVTPFPSVNICNGQVQNIQLTNIAAPVQVLNEGFNTVVPLPTGWVQNNLSNPLGPQNWFQGNTAVFTAHGGPADSYIAANWANTTTTGVGTISNWLFTPVIPLKNGNTFEFWTRKVSPDAFPDRLEVRINTTNTGTNVGATETSTGDFGTLLLSINPTLVAGVYPLNWTKYTITLSGITGTINGRIAFRYFVTNAGGAGANSDFIGIDDVVYTAGADALGVWTANPAAPNTMFTGPVPGPGNAYVAGTPVNQIWVNPTVTTQYTVVYSTPTPCTSLPTTVTVNVINPVGTITHPVNRSVCVNGSTSFTASATGGPFTYQWEVSTNGGATYSAIPGATAATLNLTNVTQTMNNNRYRLVFTAAACASTGTSNAAILTVNPLPTVTISTATPLITPGVNATINATSNPAAGSATSWTWFHDGAQIVTTPASNTSSITRSVDQLGVYQARVVDVNGCVNTSNLLTLGAAASDKLWIYPNPTNGVFQVRIYFDGPNADFREVRIFNESGQLVARKGFDLFVATPPYLKMEFDMTNFPAGTYVVKAEEKYTGKIKSGILIIQ